MHDALRVDEVMARNSLVDVGLESVDRLVPKRSRAS